MENRVSGTLNLVSTRLHDASSRTGEAHAETVYVAELEFNNPIPTASELRVRAAIADAERLTEVLRQKAALEVDVANLIRRSHLLSEDQVLDRFASLISRTVTNEFCELCICRFRYAGHADQGTMAHLERAGWEATLDGQAKAAHRFWARYLRPRGYRLAFRTGASGSDAAADVRMTISWD
jgi:hypothetical protein